MWNVFKMWNMWNVCEELQVDCKDLWNDVFWFSRNFEVRNIRLFRLENEKWNSLLAFYYSTCTYTRWKDFDKIYNLWPESTEFNFSFSKRNRRMFRPSVSYSPHGAPHIRPTFLNTFHTFHSLTFHKQETILNKFVIIQNYILWFLTIVFPKV